LSFGRAIQRGLTFKRTYSEGFLDLPWGLEAFTNPELRKEMLLVPILLKKKKDSEGMPGEVH